MRAIREASVALRTSRSIVRSSGNRLRPVGKVADDRPVASTWPPELETVIVMRPPDLPFSPPTHGYTAPVPCGTHSSDWQSRLPGGTIACVGTSQRLVPTRL